MKTKQLNVMVTEEQDRWLNSEVPKHKNKGATHTSKSSLIRDAIELLRKEGK